MFYLWKWRIAEGMLPKPVLEVRSL